MGRLVPELFQRTFLFYSKTAGVCGVGVLRALLPSFKPMNQLTDIREIWYDRYAMRVTPAWLFLI
jgi:hypothetical protein